VRHAIGWGLLPCLLASGCLPKGDRSSAGEASTALQAGAAQPPDSTAIPTTTSVLPTPSDSSVAWPELVGTLRRNPEAVRAVMQTHARRVTVVLKDGRRYHATEPSMDAILTVLREVDPAGQILIATE
jgi:hypothetical protein